ncbi:MAG: hypothetical protein WEA81_00695, partial [Dehalococcoidia bacterium]
MRHLEHTDRAREIAETVFAQTHETYIWRQRVAHEVLDHVGHHDLAAMRNRHQPRTSVEWLVHVLTIGTEHALSRVQSHARAQRSRHAPLERSETELRV